MKKAILALTLIASASSALADSYTDRLVRNYDRRATAISSPSVYSEYDVRAWCERKVGALKDALNAYEIAVSQGRSSAAFAALKAGLVQTSQESFGKNEPLVKMSADSALVVAQKLQRAGLSSDAGALNTLEHLVRNTVSVAYEFDTNYYIEFMYRHHRRSEECGPSFMEQMHLQALRFAQGQIGAALKSATIVYGEYRPKGDARAFLTAAEVIANNTSYDLRSNLFASSIPCTIVQLGDLGGTLRSFNAGNRSLIRNVRSAVNIAGHELEEAQGQITNFGSCY